jgi:hypothetical protein
MTSLYVNGWPFPSFLTPAAAVARTPSLSTIAATIPGEYVNASSVLREI